MRKIAIAIAAMAVMMFVIPVGGASAAGHGAPVTRADVDGGWSCADGYKIEDPVSGEYDVKYGNTWGTIEITVNGKMVSFETDAGNHLVTSFLVKGGPNAILYSYASPGEDMDSGLTAPMNPRNDRYYGVSHICFFTAKK